MASSSKIILVTGANGFIASHVVNNLLESGYSVRGTVRSEASADGVRKLQPDHADRLSVVVVPDITAEGAFDEAVEGVHGVLHVASPFTLNVTDNETEMLVPAIKGTVGVLESVTKKAPRVERVVITSSFAAMVDFTKGNWPGHVYTEADWNHTTFEYAKTADAMVAYTASKALAEKAAWQFVEERKPHFKLTVLNPPMVFGPAAHNVSLAAPNLSAWDINRFLSGELDDVPETGFWSFVDVRDLAQAHVRALEVPEAGNERFFVVSGRYSYQQTADVLRRSDKLPAADKAKVPVGKPGQNYPGPDVYEVDNAKSKRILGISYRSFEESIVDAALNIVEVRQKAGSQ